MQIWKNITSDLKYSCLGLWMGGTQDETQEFQKAILSGIILHGIGRRSFIPE